MKYSDVFSFENLKEASRKCQLGVRWKPSTQKYAYNELMNITSLYEKLQNKTYKAKGFYSFDINERGKVRHIKSLHITDRVVQKCFCDYYLIPKFAKGFIYDSGTCLKGKGTSFAVKRLETHLHKYITKYKNKGYILIFDISNFFGSIDHKTLLKIVENRFEDKRLYNLYAYFINCFEGEKGLGLGSQVSQISANIYLNVLDHYIKDELGIKFYGRYMDDGYIISESKEELKVLLQKIKDKLKELKLELNPKKTQICSINNFTYLKRNYRIFSNNKISKRPYKTNILRYKRKLKKLIRKSIGGNLLMQLIKTFKGYLKEFNYFDRYTREVKQCIQ